MRTILVVDDDRLSRVVTTHLIRRAGRDVAEAGTARNALRLIAGNAGIGTLLTDVLMPDMDGLELIQAARRLRPGLRIVAMSAGGKRVKMDQIGRAHV